MFGYATLFEDVLIQKVLVVVEWLILQDSLIFQVESLFANLSWDEPIPTDLMKKVLFILLHF